MPTKIRAKRFSSQAEEAAWWKANEARLADEFEDSIADGQTGPVTLVIAGDSTVTKVRLSARDIALARTQAKERDLRCHDYLEFILREALRAAEKKDNSGPS